MEAHSLALHGDDLLGGVEDILCEVVHSLALHGDEYLEASNLYLEDDTLREKGALHVVVDS